MYASFLNGRWLSSSSSSHRCVELGEREERAVSQTREDPAFHHQNTGFNLGFIASQQLSVMSSATSAALTFELTHPFHPKRGMRFVLTTRRLNWG